MIGKVHAGGNGFRGATDYLLRGRRDAPNADRVAWSLTRNLLVDDPDLAPAIMRATARQSTRCLKPAYHFCISWRHDENPTDEVMRMVGESTLVDMGLDEHQAVLIAHNDTAHKHLHLLINRIHPGTGKAWHTGKDYERLERSMAKQAKALGLLYVPGRHNEPDTAKSATRRAKNGEIQMAARKNSPRPLDRWSKDEILSRRAQLAPVFENSRSWDQLAQNLAREGLKLARKGQGIIIADAYGFMKLSELGKDIRLSTLEREYRERFDTFTARGGNDGLLFPDTPLSAVQSVPNEENAHQAAAQNSRLKPIHGEGASDEDAGYQSEDEHPDRDADEHEKERLREEARQRRIAAREQELEERRRRRESTWTDADEAADTSEAARDPRPQPEGRKPVDEDPLSTAHEQLSKARAALDLSYAMGSLVTDEMLERAKREVELAQEKLEAEMSFADRLKSDLADVLKGQPKPKPEPEPDHDLEDDDEMEM